MSKAYAKQKAEEKKRSSASSASSYQQTQQKYEQQKKQAEQDARRAAENFTRASTNNQYNSNLQAYMDRLNALKSYGYDVSKPTAQIQQEMKRIQPAVQQENRYMQALQEQRDLERRKREARNSQPWAVRVGLVDPNEAEMTFGVYDPLASERGRLSNALAAGGKGWLAGQQNALGFALDPSQPDEAEMFFGKAPTSKLGEKISGKINEALFNQSQRLYGAADELNRQALEHETAAKQGLGKFGQTLVDVGMAGTQMALDAGIGAATGTGMASMGTRTFGQSAREALDSGATYQQAMDYGALSAAVELGTEKMFDVAKIFGGGGLDKAIEKWIVKYAKTPAGMTILRTIAGAGGEGLEEIMSSAVNPLLRSGFDPDALKDYGTSEYWADMLHEGLVGALLGGVGVAGNVITGGNARMVNEVNQAALNQRLQRADAFNAAQRNLFAGNTMQTGAADAEAARVLARNSGTQGARDVVSVRRAAQEQYGAQAKAVESVFEAGTADAETFQRQFQTAYDLGKSGAALDVAMNTPATADLNELQRENAWAIGREAGIREGTIKEEANANGETVRVRGSGERDAGQSAAGQVQQVEGNAGSYQEGRSLGIGRSAKDSAAADLRYSEEVKSARDLGIENGAVIKNLRTVDESSYTPEMREYAQEQAANGHKVTFVSGLIHAQDGPGGMITRARGMVNGNGDVIIQADNERFTALQIGRHEDGHLRIARGEIDLAAKKEAVRASMGQEQFDRAMQDYAEAYAGLDMTADEIWEEIVCDAQGEMNIFEGTLMQNAEQRASDLIREAKAQTTAGETTQQRAPPEKTKFSMETPVEETRTLVALHNLDEDNLRRTLKLGAFPSPSIAIVKAEQGHSKYGSITAVFPRSTIDPMADRRNRVYGGDAWTPTHRNARVEYPVDIDKAVKFEERIGELSGMTADGAFSSSSVLRAHGVDNETNMTAQEIADRLVRDDAVRAAYLAATGTAFEPEYAEKQFDRRFGNETVSKAAERIGEDRIDEIVDALNSGDNIESAVGSDMQTIQQIFLEFYADLNRSFTEKMGRKRGMSPEEIEDRIRKRAEKSLDDVSVFTYEDFVRNVYEYIHSEEKTGTEIDRLATLDKMKAAAPDADVKQWLLGEMEGLLGEPGIYNGKDYYTPSGNRRSFKQLHWEYTAENIVRAMNNASARGENYFGFGASGLHAVATTNFQNVQQMHDEENRLRAEDAETYQKKFEELDKTIQNCVAAVRRETKAHSSNSFEEQEIIGSVMMMAAQGTRTVKGVQGVFRSEGYTISDSTAKQMLLAFQEAAEIPTEYFEAKPQRVVGFDETAALIVPDNIDAALKRDAESAGMNVLTYKAGDEADRLRVVNSVEGAKFSRETDLDQLARENRALQKETDELRKAVQKWKGETKLTTRATLREQDVRKAAKQMLRDYNSKANAESVGAKLRQLGELIMNGESGEAAHWSDVRGLAEEIAEEIVNAENVNVNGDEFENFQLLTGVLKEKPIHVSEADLNDILAETGYETIGAFNRAYRGTVRITTEAAKAGDKTAQDAYYEMVEAMPGWFPEDVSEAEYVPRMLQVLEGLKPIYGMSEQTSANYEAAVTWAANDVIDRVLDESIRQNPKTFADRAQAKYDKERARLYQRIRKVREQGNERVERTKREYTERSRKAIERMQARQEREIQKLKDRQREARQNERERREEREGISKYRRRVEQKAKQLGDWLLKNSAKEHIPENLKKPVAEFLATIDFTSKRQLRGGEETQKDKRFAERLRALTSTLEKMQSGGAEDSLDSIRQHEGLPPYYMEFLKMLSEKAVTAMESGDVYTINQMTAAELKTLDETITAIVKTIRMMNRLYENGRAANAQALGFETIEEMDKLGAKKASGERGDAVRSFFAWDNTNPFYAFKRLGSAAASVFEEIQNGWDRFAFNVIKIMDFTKEAYTSEEVRKWGNEVHEFELESGEKVYMTTAQIMSLRMLLRREQAVQHIQGGGVRIDDIDAKGKGNKHLQAEHYHLTAKDIEQITGTLTERQREVASALQKFMQQQGGEWGNHVSRARWDIDFFGEENYFPIVTEDSDRNAIDPEARANDLFRLLNMGATKSLNPNANNALVIRDIFDVFADHMTDMAKYDGLALPILDAMKWLNYRYREETSYDEETGKSEYRSHTVQRAIEKAYGKEALRYLTTFMRDLNGVNESTGRGEGFARKMISNYKVAAVAANLRVALLQPTSYFRALYSINGRYLARAIFAKPAVKECEKYSGMAAWKSLGYYDTNIARGVREQIKDSGGMKDKVQSASMKGAEWGDKLTWGALWNACKFAVKNEQPGLDHEALMEATAKKFREVVYSTQVVDSTMTRSHNMRGKSLFGSMATAFMAEPTLSYNIVMDAVSEFQNEARRTNRQEAWKKTHGKVAKAFTVYCLSGIASAIAESLMDAFRDDDEYEKFYQKFLEAMLGEKNLKGRLNGNLANDLLIFNKLPVVKDFMSLLSGYSNDRIDMEWMSNAVKAIGAIVEKIELDTGKLEQPTKTTYYGNMTWYGAVYLGLKTLSQATGLPVGSATREVVTLWNNTVGSMTGQKIVTYDSKPEKQIQKGFENGWLTEENAIRLLVDEGAAKDEDDAWFKVQKWSTGDGKFDAAVDAMLDDDKKAFNAAAKNLTAHGVKQKSVESSMKSAIKKLYVGTDEEPASISADRAKKLLQDYVGMKADEAAEVVTGWRAKLDTGYELGEVKEAYLDGDLSRQQVVDMRMKYAGDSQEDAEAYALRLDCEKEFGIEYGVQNVMDAVVDGSLTDKEAREIWKKYGGKDDEYIDKKLAQAEFVKQYPSANAELVNETSVAKFREFGEPTGIKAADFLQYWDTMSGYSADVDVNGKTINGSKKQKVINYIASLPITSDQKTALYLAEGYALSKLPSW